MTETVERRWKGSALAALMVSGLLAGCGDRVAPGTAEVFLVGDVLRPFAEAKDEFLARFEARYCEAVLAKAGGNIALAARLANMDKKNLHRKIRAYGLDATAHKRRET